MLSAAGVLRKGVSSAMSRMRCMGIVRHDGLSVAIDEMSTSGEKEEFGKSFLIKRPHSNYRYAPLY